jgi:hypothetical protein
MLRFSTEIDDDSSLTSTLFTSWSMRRNCHGHRVL